VEVTASAPGKVFVTGEYAVVAGGPAVIATVSRRLRARVRARRGSGNVLVRGRERSVRCTLRAERFDDLPSEARFVAGAAVITARALGLRDLDLDVETESELDPGAVKAGLGGSAAVTAATVTALHALARRSLDGDAERQARLATAVYAHRLVQGGGSGADVVASAVGGVVWTTDLDGRDVPRDATDCLARLRKARPIAFERLVLPPGLVLEVVATGRACATGPRVERFAQRLWGGERDAAPLRAWTAGMRVAVDGFRAGCRAADAELALRALRAASRLLSRLGAVAAIPVYTPELRRAAAAASPLGAAVKPSGAGGGDCAVALVRERDRERLFAAWRASGLEPLAASIEGAGARLEEGA
jgi:phosphomevalonate kinase